MSLRPQGELVLIRSLLNPMFVSQRTPFKIVNGTNARDEFSTYELEEIYPGYEGFEINGLRGDDLIWADYTERYGTDILHGGDGDDEMVLLPPTLTPTSFVQFNGDFGTDILLISEGITSISEHSISFSIIEFSAYGEFGQEVVVWVFPTTEIISFGGEDVYLTEDIVNGRIRTVDSDELFARTTGDNADWYMKGLDTYTWYHSQTTPEPEPQPGNPVHRLYNSSLGKHLFSSNEYVIDFLTGRGGGAWQDEGVIYIAPKVATADVFHFYIPSEGRHFYTALESERDFIIGNQEIFSGWRYEGAAFSAYSTSDYPDDAVAVVRYLNQETGSHVYSTSAYEQSLLDQNSNWMNEGIAWFGDPMIVT